MAWEACSVIRKGIVSFYSLAVMGGANGNGMEGAFWDGGIGRKGGK